MKRTMPRSRLTTVHILTNFCGNGGNGGKGLEGANADGGNGGNAMRTTDFVALMEGMEVWQ
jgi:hypothetical protein